jgi:ABC-2 type transport system permease protein
MSAVTVDRAAPAGSAMTLRRLEWLRLWRTGRLVALVGVFAFFGVTSAPLNRYMASMLEHVGGDVRIIASAPVPTAGFATYTANADQIGLLVFVFVVAAAVAIHGRTEMAIFLRTRVPRARLLLWPRYSVSVGAGVAAYGLGVVCCWFGTVALLGDVDGLGVVVGAILGALYLVFVGAVAALLASVMRSVVTTAVGTLGVALGLGLIGALTPLDEWLPGHLPGALAVLAGGGDVAGYARAALVTVAATAGLLGAAAHLADRREL